jgi:hypothetical protein
MKTDKLKTLREFEDVIPEPMLYALRQRAKEWLGEISENGSVNGIVYSKDFINHFFNLEEDK